MSNFYRTVILTSGVLIAACGGTSDMTSGSPAATATTPVVPAAPKGPIGATPTASSTTTAPSTTPATTANAAGAAAPVVTPTMGTMGTMGTTPVTPTTPATTPTMPTTPAGMTPAANGGSMMAATGGDTWTPQSNLDASGQLMAPAAGTGFQITSTPFDLQPGQELFNCFHVAAPNDKVFPVGMWEAQMSAGSHHFILYRSAGDASATAAGALTQGGCTQGFGGNSWLYTQGSPRSHLQFPEGVAMELQPNEKINFDMHYINTGTDVIHAKITLNVNQVKAEKYQKADAQISFNTGIAIPPHGEQTVQGDCQPVMGANYFLVQTHTHKHATMATVSRTLANGMPGETFVTTTNWDTPQAMVWQQAPFLTFKAGEKMHYSCSYKNDSANLVTVGTSADTNEMCMAEAYFYPAAASTPVCN